MSNNGNDDGVKRLSPDEVAVRIAARTDAFLVDVRDPREYRKGKLPEALLIPADDFADRFERELDPDDEVIIVCEKGMTSEAAARFLISQGFTNVATMTGGMVAYNGPLKTD